MKVVGKRMRQRGGAGRGTEGGAGHGIEDGKNSGAGCGTEGEARAD
jgi:hypothetical protein